MRALVVLDAHQSGGLARGLQRLGDDGRDDLAAVGDRARLEERQLGIAGFAEPRGVVRPDDGEHAAHASASAASTARTSPEAIVACTGWQ